MTTVAAVDRHAVVLRGLTSLLHRRSGGRRPDDLHLAGVSRTVTEHLAGPGRGADVVLLEPPPAAEEDIEAAVHRLVESGSVVLLHTAEPRPVPLRRGVAAGAAGLVLKEDDEVAVLTTVRGALAAAAGGGLSCSSERARALLTDPALAVRLAPQQVAVLRLAAQGHSYIGIGRSLSISRHTVRTHLSRAAQAYTAGGRSVDNTHALVHAALSDGHLDPPPLHAGSPRPPD